MRNYETKIVISGPTTLSLMKEYCRIMDIAIKYGTEKWTKKETKLLPFIESELLNRGEKLPSY